MAQSSLTIEFSSFESEIAAHSITFSSALTDNLPITSTRGAFSRDWFSDRCFRWTSAVCALAYLAVIYRESAFKGGSEQAFLSGGSNTMACSLDYALTKKPSWLMDVFGISSGGTPNAHRLLERRNSCRKMPGPVLVRFNPRLLSPSSIRVLVNGKEVMSDLDFAETKTRLAKTWQQKFGGAVEQEVAIQQVLAA